jgi:hypothetical protein
MSHQAKVIDVKEVADGILSVKARCCANKSTDSVLSLHELGRSDEEIDADIQKHLEAVEKKHADRDRAKQHVERLMAR